MQTFPEPFSLALSADADTPASSSAVGHTKPSLRETDTQTTYYVDADMGDDDESGTSPARAWRTLDKINSTTFEPGDTIRFRGGNTWHGGLHITCSGAPGRPVTFTSYGKGRPTIAGGTAMENAVLLENTKYLTLRGFEITNGTDLGVSKDNPTYRGVFAIAKDIGEVPGLVIRDNYIHNIDGLGGPRVSRGGIGVGVRGNLLPTWYSDLLIENNEVGWANAYGISTFTTWCGSNRNFYAEETGVPMSEVSDTRIPFTRTRIIDNYVHDVTGGGILAQYVDDGLIEGNTVDRAGSHLLKDFGSNAGIWWQGTDRITVQYNVVRHQGHDHFIGTEPVDGMAFDADMDTSNSLVQYNYSDSNAGGFIMCLISATNNTVRYNVSRRDYFRTFSIWSGCHNLRAYNNTIWGTKDTVTRHNPDGTTFQQPMDAIVRNQTRSASTFFNNIFYNPGRGAFDKASDVPASYSHNLYWDESGTPVLPTTDLRPIIVPPRLANPDQELPDGKVSRTTLLRALRDYTPAAGSPVFGAGISAATAPSCDGLGTQIPDGNPDLGAIQHAVPTSLNSGSDCAPAATDMDRGWKAGSGSTATITYADARKLDGLHLLVPADVRFHVDVDVRDATGRWATQAQNVAVTGSTDPTWFRVAFPSVIAATAVKLHVIGTATVLATRGTYGKVAGGIVSPAAVESKNVVLPTRLQIDPGAPQTVSAVRITSPTGQQPTKLGLRALNDGIWHDVLPETTPVWHDDTATVPLPEACTGVSFELIIDESPDAFRLIDDIELIS